MNQGRRARQVIALYACLGDYDFEPPTATGALVARSADPRGRIEARTACGACAGEGRRRRRGIEEACPACGGRGTRTVDAYTLRPLATEDEPVCSERWVRCDACGGGGKGRAPGVHGNGHACGRCQGSGRPGWIRAGRTLRFPEAAARVAFASSGEGDPIFAAALRRQAAGSFCELEAATQALRLAWQQGCRLVLAAYVERSLEPAALERTSRGRLKLALAYVTVRMPEPIRVPARCKALERAA